MAVGEGMTSFALKIKQPKLSWGEASWEGRWKGLVGNGTSEGKGNGGGVG
jgi:hypothetical protein